MLSKMKGRKAIEKNNKVELKLECFNSTLDFFEIMDFLDFDKITRHKLKASHFSIKTYEGTRL